MGFSNEMRMNNVLPTGPLPSNNGSSNIWVTPEAPLKKMKLAENASNNLLNNPTSSTSSSSSSVEPAKYSSTGQTHRPQVHNRNPPSRVLHFRGLASGTVETDIAMLALPFGFIGNCLMLRGRNQALLEMADLESAIAMVNFYNSGYPCLIKGQPCFVQFSSHKEISTDETNSNNSVEAQAALKAFLPVVLAQTTLASPMAPQIPNDHGTGGPRTILRLFIQNIIYPVTLEMLHGIFSRYGQVLRIILFTKKQKFGAFIQFPDEASAASAKEHLDLHDIYPGSCKLRIEFSAVESIRVLHNNETNRDYINPTLPTDAAGVLSQYIPAAVSADTADTDDSDTVPVSHLGRLGQLSNPSCVVLASNIHQELVTPDVLFTLFGLYGNVLRIKIIFGKKDTALVQFSESRQAQLATLYLDRVKLYGKAMKVSISRHMLVKLHKTEVDAGLAKDFTNSPLHRFRKPASKNYQNIFAPAATLHLSNIPTTLTEEDMMRVFHDAGYNVKQLRFFPKDRKMALLQLGNTQEAVECLVKMHNVMLAENTPLRVAFSKTVIKD